MPTVNYNIAPEDGWVQVATAPKFARISGYPHTQPYYLYAGSSAPGLTAIAATQTVTFATGVPIADETVTVGSEVYTFKASRVNPFEVAIGGSNTATAANFKTAVNTDSTLVAASGASNVITLTAKIAGTAGDYAISEAATNVTVGGATLTGGTDITVGQLNAHHAFVVNVTMTENLYARVVNPQTDGRKFRLDVVTIT